MRQNPIFGLVLLAACQEPTTEPPVEGELVLPDEIADSCDPTDPSLCILPFPSSHFLVKDDSTPTGARVALADDSLPVTLDDVQILPTYFNEKDGFSINSAMLMHWPDVSLDGTVSVTDIGAYEELAAKTVILNAETGERHPHWVEADATAPDDTERMLILRPAVPFEWGTRYVVAIRGLTTKAGDPVPVSKAFAALRDSKDGGAVVAARQAYFDLGVFPVIEEAGITRDELQLAWDFTTTSRDNTLGRLEWMRDDALAWLDEQGGFDIEITESTDRDCEAPGETIARDLRGTFVAPLYMQYDQPEDIGTLGTEALLTRDENGQPFRNGTTVVDWLARIPCSVAKSGKPAPVVQYGHGLLGGKGEARTGYLAKQADTYGFLIFAMDWTGFMEDDVAGITYMLASAKAEDTNQTHFAIVPERTMQGMVEFVLGMRMMLTDMMDNDAFDIDDSTVIDPTIPMYYGNSQGAILGAAYVPLSPDIERGVLGVGGGPYSLLLPRSGDFGPFFQILRNKFLNHLETMSFVIGVIQQLWDPTEPGGWVWDMTRDAAKPKTVLQQVAIFDHQVTTLGAHYQSQAYGAVLPSTRVRPVWGLDEVELGDGYEGNVLVEWKYDWLPDEPTVTLPPGTEETLPEGYVFPEDLPEDTHECPRRQVEAQEQAWIFLTEGKVVDTCPEGGCVSSTCGTPGM